MKKLNQILILVTLGFISSSCCGTTVGNGTQCNPELDPQFGPNNAHEILQYISSDGGFSLLYPSIFTAETDDNLRTVTFNDQLAPAGFSFGSQVSFTIVDELPADLMIYAQGSGLCPSGNFVIENQIANAEGVVCFTENTSELLEAIYLLKGSKLIQASVYIPKPNAHQNLMDDVLYSFTSHGM